MAKHIQRPRPLTALSESLYDSALLLLLHRGASSQQYKKERSMPCSFFGPTVHNTTL